MGVMMLAAGIGSTVTIEADGEDEQEALDAVSHHRQQVRRRRISAG